MNKKKKIICLTIFFILFLNLFLTIRISGCKDIVAVGNSTAGNYNLLLKIRDPSRPGIQVLCIVPKNYNYIYQHPWTGRELEFITERKYIGIATKGDTIPNIVKAGMAMNDMGISFGDADTNSRWVNPSSNAWDDFDWIRYACEKAKTEDEAVNLLTNDLVDQMHATGVSENLFVVGPKKSFLIEADAYRYNVEEIQDTLVMSNYPKNLWKTQIIGKLPIASSFGIEKEKFVREGMSLRLNSLFGVRITNIEKDKIYIRMIPFFEYGNGIKLIGDSTKIIIGERKTVGDYSVKLLEITENKAKISVKYHFKAWEDKLNELIQLRYGSIDVKDMINWSRLHKEDLDGLRPMCEHIFPYESAMIFKIPEDNYQILSTGWFAANHPCSSIYVPIHICDLDIYEPYKTGFAAETSMKLLEKFEHEELIDFFSNVEEVFLKETKKFEKIALKNISESSKIKNFFTIIDMGMQKQAMLTQQILLEACKEPMAKRQKTIGIIKNIWKGNYSQSLNLMEIVIYNQDISKDIKEKIIEIYENICFSQIELVKVLDKNTSKIEELFDSGKRLLETNNFSGFKKLNTAFSQSELIMKENKYENSTDNIQQDDEIIRESILINKILVFLVVLFITTIISFLFIKRN